MDPEESFLPSGKLLELAEDSGRSPAIRVLALQNVKVDHPGLTITKLAAFAEADDPGIRREAIRALVLHPDSGRESVLAKLAADISIESNLRADAIAGLAAFAAENSTLLETLSREKDEAVSSEAARALASTGLVERALRPKPAPEDIAAWEKLLGDVPGQPSISVGRRLFFYPRLGICSQCHSINGRGTDLGPDLSALRDQEGIDQTWLLRHIIDPNAEMAPYFRPQIITTSDGKTFMGLVLGREGGLQTYVGPDGKKFSAKKTISGNGRNYPSLSCHPAP